MREWISRIFAGRRGPDALGGMLFVMGLILSAVAWFTHNNILAWLVYLPWAVAAWRMLSTNTEKRYRENRRFLCVWDTVKNAVVGFFIRLKSGRLFEKKPPMRVSQTESYRHFVCPACSQKLRVPKGRGKVVVTCPKCSNEFEIFT